MKNKNFFLSFLLTFSAYTMCDTQQPNIVSAAVSEPYILSDAEKTTLDIQVEQSLKKQKLLSQYMHPLLKDFLVKTYNEKYEKINELSDTEFDALKVELSAALDTFIKENEDNIAQKAAELYEIAGAMQKAYFIYSFKKSFSTVTKEQVIEQLELQREVRREFEKKKSQEKKP